MRVLLVAATTLEAAEIMEKVLLPETIFRHHIEVLITGIGMVNTAYQLAKKLNSEKYDLAINIGIAGSYDQNLQLSDVVEVIEETYADMGVEAASGFEDLKTMGFVNFQVGKTPFFNRIPNPKPSNTSIPKVTSLTMNRVSGTHEAISQTMQRWNKQLENMEGAAFFQVCLQEKIPFYVFRGISNYVEPRNKDNWKIRQAVEKVQSFTLQFLENLT